MQHINKNLHDLYRTIDNDTGLKSKRNLLNITSLILLAIQFTGAEIIEANTFILKLSFKHQNGIGLLLVMSIVFFLIRYYNYAKHYHNELYKIWSQNLLNDNAIDYYCPESNEVIGLLHRQYPRGFFIDEFLNQDPDSYQGFTTHYECKLF